MKLAAFLGAYVVIVLGALALYAKLAAECLPPLIVLLGVESC